MPAVIPFAGNGKTPAFFSGGGTQEEQSQQGDIARPGRQKPEKVAAAALSPLIKFFFDHGVSQIIPLDLSQKSLNPDMYRFHS
ncbi:hypothetical protein [Thermoactinomyces sp. CICC 10521]|uniref:hypothetical protein n=1 Tax=Thermoactinomyces sp. CICC 10521 TaxID=2767426 RepID=UPI0018DE6C5B|nr:hypothetical protein [Thermoactinomyces sp. CICC 10521]MBH8608871.1 hypothetical protein [Thermoactinomyces sp. CICC 10521]